MLDGCSTLECLWHNNHFIILQHGAGTALALLRHQVQVLRVLARAHTLAHIANGTDAEGKGQGEGGRSGTTDLWQTRDAQRSFSEADSASMSLQPWAPFSTSLPLLPPMPRLIKIAHRPKNYACAALGGVRFVEPVLREARTSWKGARPLE